MSDRRENIGGFENAHARERKRHACKRCHGTGIVRAASVDPLGMMRGTSGCPDCGGTMRRAGTGRDDRIYEEKWR
jgi:DnaJ-class molecular chaperone